MALVLAVASTRLTLLHNSSLWSMVTSSEAINWPPPTKCYPSLADLWLIFFTAFITYWHSFVWYSSACQLYQSKDFVSQILSPQCLEGILLWCRGLKIPCCHCSSLGHCWGVGSIPGPGTSYATGVDRKKKERNKEEKKLPSALRADSHRRTQ